jgi:hypothetical protein
MMNGRFCDAFFSSRTKFRRCFFLERRTEYIGIGKAASAQALVKFENNRLFKYDDNWFRYLYNVHLATSFDKFSGNQLCVIPFNYDRTVEHFLFSSLKNGYGKNDVE